MTVEELIVEAKTILEKAGCPVTDWKLIIEVAKMLQKGQNE